MPSTIPPRTTTLEFYRKHAGDFARTTASLEISSLYNPFLNALPRNAHILDAGCGSGRDTKAFLDMGYKITAVDLSPELAQLASALTGRPCQVLAFQDMTFRAEFDGIWACASLLHVPRREMSDVLKRFADALKPGGTLYASLKAGDGERVAEDGRFFSYFQEEEFNALLTKNGRFELLNSWLTHASDSSGHSWPWLNFLAARQS